jgi:hypothetical protein
LSQFEATLKSEKSFELNNTPSLKARATQILHPTQDDMLNDSSDYYQEEFKSEYMASAAKRSEISDDLARKSNTED